MGQVLINPALLSHATPSFVAPSEQLIPQQETKPVRPAGHLMNWLDAHSGGNQARTEAQRWAEDKVAELAKLYRQACAYNGLAVCQLTGPGRSQWGRVEEVAKQRPTELNATLFTGTDAICKASDEDWNTSYGPEDHSTYTNWLKQQSQDAHKHVDAAYRIALLADHAQKLISRLGQGE